ncbi:MAG TPA: hypothetical protein VFG59_16145 [Anaeromyxobacter sp.]|nr:hypothetical protein [Anaeromyxobacter sp.]
MAATKKPAGKKLSIKDLGGKEVDKQEMKKVKGGTRIICYSQKASGGVKR